MQTAAISIRANKRVPFDDTIALMAFDYSSATFQMQIRNEPGDQGAPLVGLGAFASGQGISCTYDPEFPDPEDGEPGASIIRIQIAEATLEGLPYASDPAAERRFFYDLHVTPAGGTKYVFSAGAFVVVPGVTL